MQRALALVVLTSLAAASAVASENTGFYVAADAAMSGYDISQDDVDALVIDAFASVGFDVLDGDSSLDDSDTGFGVTLGYQFSPYVAVEATYFDLGEASYSAAGLISDGEFTAPVETALTAGSSGPALSLLGILPINDAWDVYARAGMFFADNEVTFGSTIEGESFSQSDSEGSEEFYFGAGTSYSFGDHWTVRLDYQMFKDVGVEEATGEADVDLLGLGVLYHF